MDVRLSDGLSLHLFNCTFESIKRVEKIQKNNSVTLREPQQIQQLQL